MTEPGTPFGSAVTSPPDATPADWIPSRLGAFGSVGGLIPSGFERYVLVDHADLEHPDGWQPAPAMLATLAAVASTHTETPDLAWFAVWEGHGWESATRLYGFAGGAAEDIRAERERLRKEDDLHAAALRAGLAAVPTFELPNRRYLLLHGPVTAASAIDDPGGHGTQPPDLWWPEDRAWFVATDTDLTWSYVGGPAELVGEVHLAFGDRARPVRWDAWNAQPSD